MFDHQVRNFETARTAPAITIIGESGLVKRIGICDDQMQLGCERGNVPSQARAIMRPGSETLNPKPETRNPKAETPNLKPHTPNPKSETLNPTPFPTPEPLNPKS
jgi:hypothetical protein